MHVVGISTIIIKGTSDRQMEVTETADIIYQRRNSSRVERTLTFRTI